MPNNESAAPSLKRRVLGASFWSLGGFAVNYVLRLGSSLLMTRLLVPQMFGVMAIATMVMTGLAMFSNVGLRPTIVQNARGHEPAFLNTAWAIQIIRGFLMWLLALCLSLFIVVANHLGLVSNNSVYADPSLPYVLAVVSISAAIGGFESTKFAEASRHLLLGRVTKLQMIAQISGLLCMVAWALLNRSIWALVAGGICSATLTTLLSHLFLPGTPNRWHWDPSAFKEIFHFGKWMFLSSILGFFVNNSDRILLGGFVDSATLGIYSIAYNVFSSLAQIINKIVSDVSYSAFSEVARERPSELKRALYKFHFVTASFAYTCSGLLFISGHTLIALLYDRRYEHAGSMLEVLAVGLIAGPFALAQYCFLALKLPKTFTKLIVAHLPATFLIIPLGFHFFGLPGALWGIVISYLSGVPLTIYYQLKYHLLDLLNELAPLPFLVAGMVVGKSINIALGH